MEIYIKPPSKFILNYWQQLLPQWIKVPQTVILILLPSQYSLDTSTEIIELEKNRLLLQFMIIAKSIKILCEEQGLLSEIISPKDGFPLNSLPGKMNFDLVAITHELLGFDFYQTSAGCKVLYHPQWGSAMYTSMIISLGSLETISKILQPLSHISN
jgi:hypothetical protein